MVQNWDCHGCAHCCRDYRVPVTEEERQRILAQGWDKDPDLGDLPVIMVSGPWWRRRYRLSERGNGNCVFLDENQRCRIHARFGAEAKPLACRMFPFVLVPTDTHWRVGLRFACPSVAGNKGGPFRQHEAEVTRYAGLLEKEQRFDVAQLSKPELQTGQILEWSDLARITKALEYLLHDRRDRLERRLRKWLALANLCRQARFEKVKGERLTEFFDLLMLSLDAEVPVDPGDLEPPSWIGRLLLRQSLLIYLRKDHGPERGEALRSRLSLFHAAWRFAKGTGAVPRLNQLLPDTTFDQVEQPVGPLSEDVEEILERYYTVKLASLQFQGPTNFGMTFWDGLESLVLTLPLLLWVTRALREGPREEAVVSALRMIDDHFGYNPLLGSRRQRLALRILASRGELSRLVAWYSR